MRINHNIAALNTHRQLTAGNAAQGKSMEKLSSGLRINRAGDDAAGLAISEKMRSQIKGLDMAAKNSQDGISLIQTAEGALNETHDILQRMRELATQAANDTNTGEDRGEIQKEINQLTSEINRIGNTTEFNKQKVLDGGETQRAAQTTTTGGAETAATTYQLEGAALDLTATNADLTTNNQIKFSVEGGADIELTLAGVDYDGTTGNEASDLVDDINAKIQADTDLKDAGLKAEIKDDKIVFTSSKEIEIKAGTADALGDLGIAAGTLTEVEAAEDTTTTNTNQTFNATLQIGANKGQAFEISIMDMRASALGISQSVAGGGGAETAATTYQLEGAALDLTATNADLTTNNQIKFSVEGGADIELTLAGVDYDGTTGKEASDLVDDINAKIQANTDLKDAGLKAEIKDDKIVFTSSKEIEIKAGTADALGDLGIAAGTLTEVEAAEDTTTTAGTAFTKDPSVTNGTTSTTGEKALDVSTHANATNAIDVLDKAIAKVSGERSKLGAYQNRLEHTINNLNTSSENLTAAESRIRDVDMAKEMMEQTKNSILSQAAQAMLAQANQQPQGVLQLLR